MHEALLKLWVAVNNHSLAMGGEYVVSHDGDDIPPPPSDDEIVDLVRTYLEETI